MIIRSRHTTRLHHYLDGEADGRVPKGGALGFDELGWYAFVTFAGIFGARKDHWGNIAASDSEDIWDLTGTVS